MRKIILSVLVLSLIGIFSCGKDETAPKVMLKGDAQIDHVLNSEFIEPGFAAFDNEDGDITANVTVSNLDIDKSGKQIINYTVTDTEGNEGKVNREVTIFNEAQIIEGYWSGEYIYPYPSGNKVTYNENVSTSEIKNMDVVFTHFGDNADSKVKATLTNNTLSFEDITLNGKDLSVTKAALSNEKKRITIEYTYDGQNGVLVLVKNN